jgi:predicted AlkP superfamily phosphohydrolase/phosphomutase
MMSSGVMPHFTKLAGKSFFQAINSVQPPVSSSAWASFLTGKQPDEHGILSFTERDPASMEWYTPDARHLKVQTIIQKISAAGRRVFIMNVPVTYPAVPVNGVSICGFLGTDLKKGVYPAQEAAFLIDNDYKIDVDTERAKTDLAAYLNELNAVLEKRIETMWYYFARETWDFFMTHIMETDRLFHFTWEYMENKDPVFINIYQRFFRRLDDLIGQIIESIDQSTTLMLLSDHGFTTLKQEVYLNRWLWENDYLKFNKPIPHSLLDIHPQSSAYALYPGRIFINLKGREKNGSVKPGNEYEETRRQIKENLKHLTAPNASEKIINDVVYGEKIYAGNHTLSENIADLFVLARDGYDLKGQLWSKQLFNKTVFNGMHTFNNAFVLIHGQQITKTPLSLSDISAYIYQALNIENTVS